MSGIAHAVKKVFKGVVGIVKKVWKPLVIAAAIYFTGGMALGAMGALSAGGSVLAGAGAGLSAAAGGIGIGAGAGIGGAFAAGAGTAALEGAGAVGAGILGAGAADVGAGTLGAGEAVAGDLGLGATAAGAGEGATMGGVGMLSSLGGDAGAAATGGFETLGGEGVSSAVENPGAYTYAGPEMTGPPSSLAGSAPGAPSSLWDKSLSIAGQIMKTPGMPSLIGGFFRNYEQGKMMEAQQKWAEAHAPGQIAGGAAGAWGPPGTFAMNKNLTPNTPMPTAGKLPALSPYTQPSPLMPGVAMPGYGQPGSQSSQYPGYGTPGYGQQPPVGGGYPPSIMAPQVMPEQQDDGGLLSQTPFIDSPYDQSYA